MSNWTADNMPDQSGRIAIVTGANSGLGLSTTIALARKGAAVIMACRNVAKGKEAFDAVKAAVPGAQVELMALDLGSLESVKTFAQDFKTRFDRLDVLMNNAGLMAIPRSETADGFEMQLGVNHLGHFALTARLIDRLLPTPGSRVVTVTSSANWMGSINFDDLMGEKRYTRYGAYGQSKLANVVFANELQRRLQAAGAGTISNSAHPGFVITNLQARAVHETGSLSEAIMYGSLVRWMAQTAEWGILPQLYAATAPEAQGGALYGPNFMHIRGYPKSVTPNKQALDPEIGKRLWEVSESLAGTPFAIPTPQRV